MRQTILSTAIVALAGLATLHVPATVAASPADSTGPTTLVAPAPVALPGVPDFEVEPNDTTLTATPITSGTRIRGDIFPNGDVDRYAISASAGDRLFAAVVTNGSSNGSTDSQLRVFDPSDALVEFDEDDGTLGGLSSTISGAVLSVAGTYTIEVKHFTATNSLRPYDLFVQLRSGTPTPEVEANDSPGTATPLGGGFVSGTRNPASATEQDWYSMSLNAGDTVYLSLDLDPERDNVQWNGRLSLGQLGDAQDQLLIVDDNSTGTVANPLSEMLVTTVRTSGTYYAVVDSASAATGGPTATYQLSANVLPAATRSCRSYSTTSGPIGDGGTAVFPFSVTDAAIIDRVALRLDIDHALMADIDANLQSPAGNDNSIFTDIGASATGDQTEMTVTWDDFAAIPPISSVLKPLMLQPERDYRLDLFNGEQAQGTWNLVLRDDVANASAGSLDAAELIICERPTPLPATTVFAAGFETSDDGFTHSGDEDEWERGTPATAATTTLNPVAGLATCGSGTGCWKTDLDNTYDVSSSQDLLSPPISLVGQTGQLTARWAQWFQIESASFDRFTVSIEENGGANPRILHRWTGHTMTAAVGTPTTNIGQSSGWSAMSADISDYAGTTVRLRFHLESDASVILAGLAIDDVAITQRDASFPITVTTTGTGSGFVDSSPSGIDCGLNQPAKTTCSAAFADGTSVTLTAHPTTGNAFSGFSGGGCTGAATTCVVTADQARAVTATFADAIEPAVTITSPANGAAFTQNSAVTATYACADEAGGSGIATCIGTVANGASVDTSVPGSYVFTVIGTDNAGNQTTTTSTYTVGVRAIVSTSPARFLDTRPTGTTVDTQFAGAGKRAAGSQYLVQITGRGAVPVGAEAVVINVTAIAAERTGFVTVHPCVTPLPTASSLNYTTGVNLGNEIIAPLSATGVLCLYTSAPAHLTGDVTGYVPDGSPVTPVTPGRFLDTRPTGTTIDGQSAGGAKPTPGSTTRLRIAGREDIPTGAAAVIVNVTAIAAESTGFVTAHPCLDTAPNAASLNYVAGVNRGNELIVDLDASGDVCLFTSAATHLAADVVGYLPGGTDVQSVSPARLLDTRPTGTTIDGLSQREGKQRAGTQYTLQITGRHGVPASATAVVANVTAVAPEGTGFVTVHPCVDPLPTASSLNHVAAVNGGNEIIASLSSTGSICLFTSNATHLTVDITGYVA